MGILAQLIKKNTLFTVSIICDGNSTTSYPDNYTLRMKSYLESKVANLTATVTNIAVSSQTSANMLADLPTQVLAANPDIVTMSVYLNDIGVPEATLKSTLRQYIEGIIGHINPNGHHTRVLLMTDNAAGENLGTSYPRPLAQQLQYKDIVLSVFNEYKTSSYVWIVNRFQLYYALGFESPLFFSKLRTDDKVHPNLEGYTTMDEPVIYPAVQNIVENIRLFK